MKKIVFTFTLCMILISAGVFFFLQQDTSQSNQEGVASTPTSLQQPLPSLNPTPKQTDITPIPTASQTPYPAAEGSFGPKGYFRIASPLSTTYANNLSLIITGQAINQPLTMAYSIDGQERVPFPAVVQQLHDWDMFFGKISGSAALPALSSGSHHLTVYGTLSGVSAQATVTFTVT
jgi:hypothetical protein